MGVLLQNHYPLTREDRFECYDFSRKAFQQKQAPALELGLRQLTLSNASGMPVGVALPHLRKLCILNTSLEYFYVGSGLESVTELGLLGLKLQFCEQILGHLGHQLVELAIWVEDNMWLDRIFRLCPNLQTFYVSEFPSVGVIGVEATAAPIMNFLTDLSLVKKDYYKYKDRDDFECADFQQGHLLLVLQSVPNLQVLRINTV